MSFSAVTRVTDTVRTALTAARPTVTDLKTANIAILACKVKVTPLPPPRPVKGLHRHGALTMSDRFVLITVV